MKRITLQLLLAVATGTFSLSAATITLTLPEYTGPLQTTGFPAPPVTMGTFNYTIPNGEQIVSASFTSSYGNSVFPDTGAVNVSAGGIAVGSCAPGDPCNVGNTIVPFSYTFVPADYATLNSGSLVMNAVQMGPNKIQLGVETLTINTAANTPEPASVSLIVVGLGLFATRLRKRHS